MDQIDVLGVPILRATREQALGLLLAAVAAEAGTTVAFANANLLNLSYRDAALRAVLRRSVVLNDGVGINTAARYLYGSRFPSNLNGTDFVPDLLDAAPPGLRVYLLGATPAVSEEATIRFRSRWPQHVLVGARHGYFETDRTAEVVEEIAGTASQVVLVGMGNRLQEQICDALADRMDAVCLAVGALFDFWTEQQPRAPLWLRERGGEWLFRLWREPARMWRRYLIGNPLFLARVWLQARRRSRDGSRLGTTAKIDEPTAPVR